MEYTGTIIHFSFIAFLLFASTVPLLGHAQLLPTIKTYVVNGHLCCTADGNCPGTPLVGVRVGIVCSASFGNNTGFGSGLTQADGSFSISRTLENVITDPNVPSLCSAAVRLPLPVAVCPILSNSTVVLVSKLALDGAAEDGSVVTYVAIGFNKSTN